MLGKMFKRIMGSEKPGERRRVVPKNQMFLGRKLRLELLEDRRVLAGTADIVFLFDQSQSDDDGITKNWMADIAPLLESHLASPAMSFSNNRYGLVNFGKPGGLVYAHSQMLQPGVATSQFGSATEFGIAAESINVSLLGTVEDGWDAIEHAVHEYNYRPGAAVIFVMVQNSEGRNNLNETLTHAGILASLESHNATLVTVIQASFHETDLDYVFGVEPDPNPLDTNFNQTSYIDNPSDPDGYSEQVFVDSVNGGADEINGKPSDTNPIQGDTDNDYVRLGWETGGSAWNVGVVQENFDRANQQESDRMDAFNEAFVTSVGNILLDKIENGDVAFGDVPLVEVNVGGLAGTYVGSYISDSPFAPANSSIINVTTDNATLFFGTVPYNSFSQNADSRLLQTGRQRSGGTNSMTWNFHSSNLPGGVPIGSYVVELFFAELTSNATTATNRKFDVYLENQLVLDNYNIYNDHAAPSGGVNGDNEMFVDILKGVSNPSTTAYRGTVKRFAVDVTDSNGLQIKLEDAGGVPLLSAIRILKADRPLTITDVILGNTNTAIWDREPFHFASIVQNGEQLRPIATTGVNRLQIRFSEDIRKRSADGLSLTTIGSGATEGNSLLTLTRTYKNGSATVTQDVSATGFTYDATSHLATWTFSSALDDGKYAIHLNSGVDGVLGIADVNGKPLDGDWTHEVGSQTISGFAQPQPTWDNFADDPDRLFNVGDGDVGPDSGDNKFRFHFALQMGDYNGDGIVNNSDTVNPSNPYSDGDGDADYDSDDTTVRTNNNNDFLPLRKRHGANLNDGADFNDNDKIDGGDLAVWQASYGIPGNADADADGDGDSDGADFLDWSSQFSNQSAWYIEVGGLQDYTAATPPKVTGVIVSGSTSAHAPYSVPAMTGTGEQLATVPVGKADTISIVFSEDVVVSGNDLVLVGMRTANVPQLAAFSYDAVTFTASWRFTGWALADNFLLFLNDTVENTEGVPLDGEWTNPADYYSTSNLISEFPSGDGTAGGAFVFVMTLLPGDINLDLVVDTLDYNLYITHLTQGGGTLFTHGDFNGSGGVNNLDTVYLSNTYLMNLQTLSFLSDLDGDDDVDNDDLDVIATNLGLTGADWEDGDLDGDGEVSALDMDLALAQWGLWIDVA